MNEKYSVLSYSNYHKTFFITHQYVNYDSYYLNSTDKIQASNLKILRIEWLDKENLYHC